MSDARITREEIEKKYQEFFKELSKLEREQTELINEYQHRLEEIKTQKLREQL